MKKKSPSAESFEHKIWSEIVKYAAVGLMGAAVATGLTWLNRLPSRSLTLLPAGIQLHSEPKLTCDESSFIAERINHHLNDEIEVPPCETPLSMSTVKKLLDGLKRADQFYRKDRIGFLQPAYDRVKAIKPDSMSDASLSRAVITAVANLEYLSRDVPVTLTGRQQLEWALVNLGDAVKDAMDGLDQIHRLAQQLSGEVPGFMARRTEVLLYYYTSLLSNLSVKKLIFCDIVFAACSQIPIRRVL
jgi:hypothetical protein